MSAKVTALANSAVRKRFIASVRLRIGEKIESIGIKPIMWPRTGGSWPGYVFTGDPLKLPAGHFGLGHGSGAHAPDEYYLIESSDPKLYGFDTAVRSFVDYLYELA